VKGDLATRRHLLRARTTPRHKWAFCTLQAAEVDTVLRTRPLRFSSNSDCGSDDGQNVLEASLESQEFSPNTPNVQPFLCLSIPPRGLWTTHRRVGVRHGRGPRTSRTDQLGLMYISTRGLDYAYRCNNPYFTLFLRLALRPLAEPS